MLTGLVFGLVPALHIPGVTLHDALKDTNRGSSEGRSRTWVRGALVVSEIAFACVLLVGAGLLIRSFLRVLDVNLGFQPERAAALRVDPDSRYKNQAQLNAYFDEVLRRREGQFPASREPASPTHSRSAATAAGASGRRGTCTPKENIRTPMCASSATAIWERWESR